MKAVIKLLRGVYREKRRMAWEIPVRKGWPGEDGPTKELMKEILER